MRIHDECLPCLVNQMIKGVHMTKAKESNELYHKVFEYLSHVDFNKTNPEIIGDIFRLLKEHLACDDPYKDIRKHYNEMFIEKRDEFRTFINQSDYSFERAMMLSIISNIIDFNPTHHFQIDEILKSFSHIEQMKLIINHRKALIEDIQQSKTLLYIGDNCGEICFDYLFIEKIKEINPDIHITFVTRGAPVVNDSIEEDAYFVGIDDYADIINNGDDSLGTVLTRVSDEFLKNYQAADIVISKGQANYENLSEEDKNIYFLLMTKCHVIAEKIHVPEKSMVCLNQKLL